MNLLVLLQISAMQINVIKNNRFKFESLEIVTLDMICKSFYMV